METRIDEPVDVLASFRGVTVMPRRFRWQGRVITVTTLNLAYRVQEGTATQRYFSVSNPTATYLLKFDPLHLNWRLESVSAKD